MRTVWLLALFIFSPAGSALAETAQHGPSHHSGVASSAENEALQVATAALDRFRDVKVATAEGYFHYLRNEDSFMMGEHWINLELIGARQCALTQPTHLQYLVIEGKRTLIGTGYFCLPDAPGGPPPRIFCDSVTWHIHGPELCHRRKGALWVDALPHQMQSFARTLPNALNPITWEDLCRKQRGMPLEQEITMLHTWNWIPHPRGPFVHENPAIPFLRAGLAVPTRELLDSEEGQAALDTLRLVYRGTPGYRAAFKVVNADFEQRQKTKAIIRVSVEEGKRALDVMQGGESRGDRSAYRSGARRGAEALAKLHADVMAVFTPDQRKLIEEFVAATHIHDHRLSPIHQHD